MSDARLRVPSYSLHSSGQACVKVRGRRIYLGKHGTKASRDAYARVVAAILAGETPTKVPPAPDENTVVTVLALAERYLEHARAYYRRDGELTSEFGVVELAMRAFVKMFGPIDAAEVTAKMLADFQSQQADLELSRSTVNGRVARVKRAFKWAAGPPGLVPESTFLRLSLVPGLKAGRSAAREPEPVCPVSDADFLATLEHLPEVVADLLRVVRYTAARPGEIRRLRPAEIDREGDVWLIRPRRHKTEHHGKQRLVAAGPKAQGVLLRYLARDATTPCFRPCDSEQRRRGFAHVYAGTTYSKNGLNQAVRRACERAGVPVWTPNQLRHAAATEVRREFGIDAAQAVLGHAHLKTTEIYAEKHAAAVTAVAAKIG